MTSRWRSLCRRPVKFCCGTFLPLPFVAASVVADRLIEVSGLSSYDIVTRSLVAIRQSQTNYRLLFFECFFEPKCQDITIADLDYRDPTILSGQRGAWPQRGSGFSLPLLFRSVEDYLKPSEMSSNSLVAGAIAFAMYRAAPAISVISFTSMLPPGISLFQTAPAPCSKVDQ